MGSDATRVFEGGGTIGRAPGNDWVLPDPEQIVSSRHASISLEAGSYVLTDLGSTNGTLVNGRELPKGGRVALNHGDTLVIGNYEIAVAVSGANALGNTWDAATQSSFFPDAGAHGRVPDPHRVAGNDVVDPLAFFDDPREGLVAQPPPASIPDHASPERQFFTPPPVSRTLDPLPIADASSRESQEVIPDNWWEAPEPGPEPSPTPHRSESAWPDAGWPDADWPDEKSAEPAPIPHTAAAPAPMAPTPIAPVPVASAPTASPQHGSAAAAYGARGGTGPVQAAGFGAPSGADPTSVDALFRAAGIDPAAIDDAALESLGEILRVVIEGVMDVLRARAEIKNQFRVAMTTLKPVENNPLKFSASVDDALFNLFARRNPSYQAPVDAFREAFADLKAHQFAVMAGMRSAFTALLKRFDPDELEDSFDRGLKRAAILDVINKTKYWELYREMYAELGNDDATFRRLFGDEFAQAYEEQMQRLAATRK